MAVKKFTIERDQFIGAVELLDRIKPRKGIKSSEAIRVTHHKGTVYMQLASDALATVRMVGEAGSEWAFDEPFFIGRNELMPFTRVGKRSKKPFVIQEHKGKLVLMQARRTVRYTSDLEGSGYGQRGLITGTVVKMATEDFDVIEAALVAANKDDRDPDIKCVHVDNKGVVRATDNLMMFRAVTSYRGDALPIPNFAVPLFGLAKKVEVTEQGVVLSFEHGQILQPISGDARANFPISNFDKFSPKLDAHPIQIEVAIEDAHRVIVEHFASYAASAAKSTFIRIRPVPNKDAYRFSVDIRERETLFADQTLPAAETHTKVELATSVKKLADVVTMLNKLYESKEVIAFRFTKDSHLVLTIGSTVVTIVRAMEGEPGAA